VTLGKNESYIFAMLAEAYRGEDMKKSNVFEFHKRSKRARISMSHMNTMLITFFDIKDIVPWNSFHKASQSTKLII
jgi:hypothetical protein